MASDIVKHGHITVEVIFSRSPRMTRSVQLQLPPGATVLDAVKASGLLADLTAAQQDALTVGVWGHKQSLGHVLRERDRVEICRPLRVDPKVARRERFEKQGARTTGLFANRRAGAKAGY